MMLRRFSTRTFALAGLVLSAAALSGCHLDMWNQRRYEAYEAGGFWGEGQSSSRPLVEGVVSYKMAKLDTHYYEGRVDGVLVDTLPPQIELTRALLERGQQRFEIYCMPCHGKNGHANGIVQQRGFPQPTSYLDQRLLESPIGYFYDVMTVGFGRMFSYATRIPVEDRWAIAAYVRTLQLSQNALPELLTAQVLEEARNPQPGKESAAGAAHSEGDSVDEH